MQAAWEQLGDVLAAERAFSLARLARDVLKRVEARHLAKLPPERRAGDHLTGARAHWRLAGDSRCTAASRRRRCRTNSSTARCAAWRARAAPTLTMARWRTRAPRHTSSVAAQMVTLVGRFADASKHLAAVDPNRFVPDGLIGSRSFDAVSAARRPARRVVNLLPYLGLDVR